MDLSPDPACPDPAGADDWADDHQRLGPATGHTRKTLYRHRDILVSAGLARLDGDLLVLRELSGQWRQRLEEPFTPVPVTQTDASSTGHVVASTWSGGSTISKETVTKSSAGTPVFSARTSYSVAPYSIAAHVPQPGTTDLINTLDNRLFQVVQSYDPRLAKSVLCPSTVTFAGDGAGVEWWGLVASGSTVAQQGVAADSNLYVFNGTVSSAR